jgi:hypothetical protein
VRFRAPLQLGFIMDGIMILNFLLALFFQDLENEWIGLQLQGRYFVSHMVRILYSSTCELEARSIEAWTGGRSIDFISCSLLFLLSCLSTPIKTRFFLYI